MAILSRVQKLLVILAFLLLLVASMEGGVSCEPSTLPGRTDTKTILRKLGYDEPKLEYYRRMLVDSERVSPGGPDPHHH